MTNNLRRRRTFCSDAATTMLAPCLTPVIQASPALWLESAWARDERPSDFTPYLQSTALIDANAKSIRDLTEKITAGKTNQRDIAVQIHAWVRDQIRFGFAPSFYEMTASEVLTARIGYCNTQATLFIALLRAAGVPSRLRVFDLSASVLDGVVDPGTSYVDHSITEVWLDGRWIGVDSYIIDRPLARAARRRLALSGRRTGFGIHLSGTSQWDGRSDSFIQCVDDQSIKGYVRKDHGLFDDIAHFYRVMPETRNKLTLLSRLFLRIGAGSINANIQAVRES